MTLQELFELENHVKYQGQRCMRVSRYIPSSHAPCPEGWVWFQIWIMANAVEDGSKCRIVSGGLQEIADLERTSVESMVVHIRDSIQQLQMHEVNETIEYKGVRFFDPHKLVHQYEIINLDNHVCPTAELTSAPDMEKEAA